MSVSVVVGAQWGDEAKGKVVDLLAKDARYVVRYAGGSNAGHTVCVNSTTYKFHLIPSGILRPHVTAVIADGVVMDLRAFVAEADALQAQGVDLSRLRIGRGVHLTMPYHRLLDELEEAQLEGRIGTTKRGIDPPTPTRRGGLACASPIYWIATASRSASSACCNGAT